MPTSPWGSIQHTTRVAPGIRFVSTARHGGFLLAPEQNAKIHPAWRSADGAYEEDCEAAIVILSFPEHFSAGQVAGAERIAIDHYPDAFEQIYGVEVGLESYYRREVAHAVRAAGKYVVTSAIGGPGDRGYGPVPEGMVGVWAKSPNAADPELRLLVPKDEYRARGEFSFIIEDPSKYPVWEGAT